MVEGECTAGTDTIGFERYLALARSAGYRGAPMHAVYVPLIDDEGVMGALRCARPERLSAGLCRDLETLARRVSGRFSKLGITAVEELPELRPLTARQHQVAALAARDLTNREIAHELAISQNSVKKHLKETFDRYDIVSRRDLRSLLARTTPVDEVPLGVSLLEGLCVVRVDPFARAVKRVAYKRVA
jgi:DNA-binding CsgD family transcriptional regulator